MKTYHLKFKSQEHTRKFLNMVNELRQGKHLHVITPATVQAPTPVEPAALSSEGDDAQPKVPASNKEEDVLSTEEVILDIFRTAPTSADVPEPQELAPRSAGHA